MAFHSSLIFWGTCISQNTRLAFPKPSNCGRRELPHSRCSGGPSSWHSLSMLFLLSSGLWDLKGHTGLHFSTAGLRCQMPECVFLVMAKVVAAGGPWGTVEITPLLAFLLVLTSGWKSVSALLDAIVLWLAFHGTDFIGSGNQIFVQISATVHENSTVRIRPYCIS